LHLYFEQNWLGAYFGTDLHICLNLCTTAYRGTNKYLKVHGSFKKFYHHLSYLQWIYWSYSGFDRLPLLWQGNVCKCQFISKVQIRDGKVIRWRKTWGFGNFFIFPAMFSDLNIFDSALNFLNVVQTLPKQKSGSGVVSGYGCPL
jgi:hypothetical protein